MQGILGLWEKLGRCVRRQKSAPVIVSENSENPAAFTLPPAKQLSSKNMVSGGHENYALLLTAPDSYFKQEPSFRELHEKRKRTQEHEALAMLEHFRRQRVEVTLPDALTLVSGLMHMGRAGLDPSEIAHIDAAHADLSREILLWQAENRMPLERHHVAGGEDDWEPLAISLRMVEQARVLLARAESCASALRVAEFTHSQVSQRKGQVVALVPLSAVIFQQLLYLRGWTVTEDNMPQPLCPVILAVHHIRDMRRTRRRLEYAPALPPLELDYSFGMDAGRTSFERQLREVRNRVRTERSDHH